MPVHAFYLLMSTFILLLQLKTRLTKISNRTVMILLYHLIKVYIYRDSAHLILIDNMNSYTCLTLSIDLSIYNKLGLHNMCSSISGSLTIHMYWLYGLRKLASNDDNIIRTFGLCQCFVRTLYFIIHLFLDYFSLFYYKFFSMIQSKGQCMSIL